MIYNDFPILNNETYSYLNEQYTNTGKDRKAYANVLYSEIQSCFALYSTTKNLNPSLKKQLNHSKEVLNQILENLKANFTIQTTEQKELIQFNIFSFVSKLSQILIITINWQNTEEKLYYKTFIKNINLSILNIIKNILSILENSNVILFKHM